MFSEWGFSSHTNFLKEKKIHFLTDVQSNSYGWFIGGCRGGGGDPLGSSLSRPWARRIRARQFQAAYGHLSVPILHFLQLLRAGGTVDNAKQLLGSGNKIANKAKIAIVESFSICNEGRACVIWWVTCHIHIEFLCVCVSKLAWNSVPWPAKYESKDLKQTRKRVKKNVIGQWWHAYYYSLWLLCI